jgi:hypothetical protein
MRARLAAITAGIALLASHAALARPAPAPGPNLKQCGVFKPEEGDPELQRTRPLPVPAGWRKVMATNRDFMAVTTIAGKTLCLFTREWESIDPPTMTNDSRYVRFGWSGYEAGGFILIDRAGTGAVFDTGARPVSSHSGRRLASVEWSESGFGSLNGILLLGLDRSSLVSLGEGAETLRELARITDLPQGLTDWRMDGWRGDGCFNISALPFAAMTRPDGSAPPGTPRRRFSVQAKGSAWTLQKGLCPAP